MKVIALCVLSAGVLLGMGSVHAAGAPAKVARIYTDTVAPAGQEAYLAGIKSYNKCLAEHGFKYKWTALAHETGDVFSYSYVSDPVSWAAFDDMHKQGKACDATFQKAVMPHLKGEISAFIEEQADLSRIDPKKGTSGALMDITYFKLKRVSGSDKAFIDAVKKITAAAEKSHWPYYYRFVRVREGGADAPDFMVVSYSTNWADLGAEADPTMWKMVESAEGKDVAADLRKALGGAIEDESSHVDSVDEELTYTPSAH